MQHVESWNVCHLRPGVHSRYFQRHTCEVLTLNFGDIQDVKLFRQSLLQLQALVLGVWQPSPRNSRSETSVGTPPSFAASSASTIEETLDIGGGRSQQSTVEGEDEEVTPTETGLRDRLTAHALSRQRTGISRGEATNFRTFIVAEEDETATVTERGFWDDGRSTSQTPPIRSGQPTGETMQNPRDDARPSRHGRYGSTASQASSKREKLSRLFRSSD